MVDEARVGRLETRFDGLGEHVSDLTGVVKALSYSTEQLLEEQGRLVDVMIEQTKNSSRLDRLAARCDALELRVTPLHNEYIAAQARRAVANNIARTWIPALAALSAICGYVLLF